MDTAIQQNQDTLDVRMSGKFTFSDHPIFRQIIEKMSDPNIRQIIFYMERIEFVDSAALGMLLLSHDEAEKNGKKIVISGIHGQVKKMFDAARLGTLFTLKE
ncbi:MAG: STAS domain-containing protein [Alphaproteobacteria bacterium]